MSNSNSAGSDAGQSAANESSRTSTQPLPAKRRRRWLRWFAGGLLTLIVLLAVLVGFLPQIASTPALRNFIFSMVNDRLRGTLQADGLALSWGGPLEVRGLTVLDPEKQAVLHVQRVTTNGGLWSLLTSGMAFGEIVVDSPNIVVKQKENGELTLAEAFQSRQPAPSEAKSETALPSPVGRLIVKSGTLTVERPAAAAYEIKELNGRIEINTLSKMTADVTGTMPDGAKLSGTADVRDLLAGGQLKPEHASGELRIASDRSVTVGPLAALLGQPGLKGGIKVECDARIDAGKLQGRFALGLSELQSAQRAAASAKPIDAQLEGNLAWADSKLTANIELSGDMGQARADLLYQHTDKPIKIASDQIVSAILTGQSLALPDFSLKAQAHIDLARLGQTVPELLKVREGVALTGGQLEISGLIIDGGATPVANATLELKDLAARRSDNSSIRLEPISLKLDSTLAQGHGLEVKQLDLASTFASIHASGSAANLQATFKSDLDRLQREIGQVIDLGAYNLAGSVNGAVDLKRVNDAQVDVGLQLTAEKLQVSGGGRTLELPRAGVSQTGQLEFSNQKLAKIVAREIKADLNGEFLASVSGTFDVANSGFKADVQISRGDLGFLAARAKGLKIDELARYSGALRMQATAERASSAQPLQTHGEMVVQNLGVDGKPVAEGDATAKWDGVELAPDGSSIRVAVARLDSTLAQIAAKDVTWKSGEKLQLAGGLDGVADIGRCITAATPVAKWDKPPQLAGKLSIAMNAAASGDLVTLSGKGGINQFVVGSGESAIREEHLQFDYDAKLDQNKQSVSINKCSVNSKPLTAELSGTIAQYAGPCQLDLTGRYSSSWEVISALLHELVPATAGSVIVAGASSSEFKITGPARTAGAQPAFRGVHAQTAISWNSADLFGVRMGAVKLAPTLADGQVTLPPTVIPAAEGKVNLGAVVDFKPQEPTLRMPGKTQLLENVAVTKELGAELLSRINPIFLYVANIEGRINLGVQDLRLPLGQSVKQHGDGLGRLDLSAVKIQPSGFLAELMALGGMKADAAHPVKISALDFVLKDGRIRYDNFVMNFPADFDLAFRGSVGLDETIDLVVSVPVRPELLARLGVKGPVNEYAKALNGVRVELPIVGTRESPRLDLSKVNVQALMKDALLKSNPAGTIDDLLKGLQNNPQKKP